MGLPGTTRITKNTITATPNSVTAVVTNRINFDRIEWKGASPVAKELPDFLVSTDRWFRPVDIKLGPDGALYVADFYNKIIGHYEVDLKHPGRDHDHGRCSSDALNCCPLPPPAPHVTEGTGVEPAAGTTN